MESQSQSPRRHRVLLVGAGHAHLYVAREARRFRRQGCDLTLMDPGMFWYSSLATGMLGGRYALDEDRIDPARLIEARGGRFVRGRLVSLDPAARSARLEDGTALEYDVVSLNLGSEVAAGMPGAEHAWTVKPIPQLWRLREEIERRRELDAAPHLTVVGGGATGCEIAANLAVLGERGPTPTRVRLVSATDRLLPDAPPGAARAVTAALEERGVEVLLATRVHRIEPAAVVDHRGRRLETDLTVLATGLIAPAVTAYLGLPLGASGGLRVDATLRSVGSPDVLAAGDCIDLEGHDLPKLGVFGVREAPILCHNLLATVAGQPLRRYRPQRLALSILNLGRGEALALRGNLWWRGRPSMVLKDWLDRRFLARYRNAGNGGPR